MRAVILAFACCAATTASALAAGVEDGAAACPRSWDFGTGSLPFAHSTLYVGSLPIPDRDPTRVRKNESWTDFDMKRDAPRRPAFLWCVYGAGKEWRELGLRVPDSVSKCVLYAKESKKQTYLSHRCEWPSGQGKPEVFVPSPLDDSADVLAIGIGKTEADLKAVAESRGGRWTSRQDGAERAADIEFPDNSIKLTVRFSATTGRSRQVEAREPMSDPANLAFAMIRRFGLPGFSHGCLAWDEEKGVRIEYGASSRSFRLMRLLDMTDPATTTWPARVPDPS